jgi:MYXO-CTERM domain-containing protein
MAPLAGCGAATTANDESAQSTQPFSSAVATLLNFEFDGELVTTSSVTARNAPTLIRRQLNYTVGQLNGSRGVGRLDRLQLSNITTETDADRNVHVRYHAFLPVSWGSKTNLPTAYSFVVPRSVDSAFVDTFLERYSTTCVGNDAHDVGTGSFWYYYRPSTKGCALAEEDIVRLAAAITRSDENTTGRYPEYHRIWEDRELSVVSVFGKYEEGATAATDAGISAYNAFARRMRSTFPQGVTEPAMLPSSVGVGEPDIEWRIALPNGLTLRVNTLLVDNIRTAGRDFTDRYNALSTEADVIAYNGHAGLGDNVAALSRKGSFRAGKYQIIFINGCDTFAYFDETLAETRARLNRDDPTGTKYMEIITNSMPSQFSSNATADMALINGLINVSAPRTYEAMFRNIDSNQIVVVTGEEDNVFTPDRDAGDWPPQPPPPPPGDTDAGDTDAGTPPPPDPPPTDPPPTDPPADDVDAGGTPPAIDASDGTDPIPPRGCSCRLDSGTPAPRGTAMAALLAGMAMLRRKRRRA